MKLIMLCIVLLFCSSCASSQYAIINQEYEKAYSAYDSGKHEMALNLFQNFVRDNPASFLLESSHYYIAKSYKESGRKEEAIQAYQDLINKFKEGNWVDWSKEDIAALNQ